MKTSSCIRLLAALGLSSLLMFTTGCLEEKDTLTVYPNGAGTIHLYQKLGEQLTGMVTSFAPADKKNEAVDSTLYKDLAKWQGVTAWAPVKVALADGRISYEATGYFDQVTDLKKTDGDSVTSFAWTATPAGGFKLVWSATDSKKMPSLDEGNDDQDAAIAGMAEMFKGLRIERAVVLPGTIESCASCTEHKGRSASFVITGDDVIKVFDMQKDYRKRIASNQITKEKATAELAEKTKVFSADMEVTSAAGNVSEEFKQFEKDYKKAKADYAAAGTADKIQQAGAH
jgi:hypothetical protein